MSNINEIFVTINFMRSFFSLMRLSTLLNHSSETGKTEFFCWSRKAEGSSILQLFFPNEQYCLKDAFSLQVLFRFALAFLKLHEEALLATPDYMKVCAILRGLGMLEKWSNWVLHVAKVGRIFLLWLYNMVGKNYEDRRFFFKFFYCSFLFCSYKNYRNDQNPV